MSPYHNLSIAVELACYSTFTERQNLDQNLQYILLALYGSIMISIWFTNSAVLYAIQSLNLMQKNGSIELICYLCLSDLALGFFGLPVLLALFLTDQSCEMEIAGELLAVGWSHTSAYIIALIGYDRFFRMKYLNRYSEVVKRKKIRCSTFVAFFLSFLHIGAQAAGIKYNFYHTITTVGIVMDWTLFVFIIIPYTLSVKVVRAHRRNTSHTQMLRQVDDTVTSVAFRITIAVTTLYSPYLILSIVRKLFEDRNTLKTNQLFLFMWFVSHGLIYSNSFTNAIIFICVNSRCRRKLLHVFCKDINVLDSVADSEGGSVSMVRVQSGSGKGMDNKRRRGNNNRM